jgi:DNA-binding MarR family transcriptional regulator
MPDRCDYQTLSEFRHLLQRFLAFSQAAAHEAGLAPRQHQALLAIKGFPREGGVTIHDLAERLCIQHHSAVELADRLEEAGLVTRRQDTADRRRMFLDLTRDAERKLVSLSAIHLEELRRLRPALLGIFDAIGADPPDGEGKD